MTTAIHIRMDASKWIHLRNILSGALNKYIESTFLCILKTRKKQENIFKTSNMVVQYDGSLRESRRIRISRSPESFKFGNVIALKEGRKFTNMISLLRW